VRGVKIGGDMVEDLKEEVKWLALGRVHTRKPFSATSLFQTRHHAWSLAQEIKHRILDKNLFLFQATCLGDWTRIMEEGPWIFSERGVILTEYDRFTPANTIQLNLMHAWVRILKIPDLFQKEDVVTDLATRVGKVVSVELRPSFFRWYW
jgi:hypothetical protein